MNHLLSSHMPQWQQHTDPWRFAQDFRNEQKKKSNIFVYQITEKSFKNTIEFFRELLFHRLFPCSFHSSCIHFQGYVITGYREKVYVETFSENEKVLSALSISRFGLERRGLFFYSFVRACVRLCGNV